MNKDTLVALTEHECCEWDGAEVNALNDEYDACTCHGKLKEYYEGEAKKVLGADHYSEKIKLQMVRDKLVSPPDYIDSLPRPQEWTNNNEKYLECLVADIDRFKKDDLLIQLCNSPAVREKPQFDIDSWFVKKIDDRPLLPGIIDATDFIRASWEKRDKIKQKIGELIDKHWDKLDLDVSYICLVGAADYVLNAEVFLSAYVKGDEDA
jgi:hypothetical protein